MSDVYTPPEPSVAAEQPGLDLGRPPDPTENGSHACPECDKSFSTAQGLGSHRWAAHGVQSPHRDERIARVKKAKSKAKITCPICGKLIRADNMKRHSQVVHEKAIADPKVPEWHTDDIFNTVVKLMYPDHNIPFEDLPALIEWRTATEKLLAAVKPS